MKNQDYFVDSELKQLKHMTSYAYERLEEILSDDPSRIANEDLAMFYAVRAGSVIGLLRSLLSTNKTCYENIDHIVNYLKSKENE